MRTGAMRNIHDQPKELDPVSKVVVAVIAIVGLLIVTYLIIDYAARVDEARPRASVSFVPGYRETVQAMLTSAGYECYAVCGVVPGDTMLKVSCDTGQTSQACAVTRSFTITLAPSPEPSR